MTGSDLSHLFDTSYRHDQTSTTVPAGDKDTTSQDTIVEEAVHFGYRNRAIISIVKSLDGIAKIIYRDAHG